MSDKAADVPPLGTIVTIPQGRGVVRFAGAAAFASGKWVGIELYEPNGKNNGSVNGQSYFTCQMNYGVFVRPSLIKETHGPEIPAVAIPDVEQRPLAAVRPVSGPQRTNSTDLLRATAGPSSSAVRIPSASSRSGSPAKSMPIPLTPGRAIPRPGLTASPPKRSSIALHPRKSFPASPSPARDSDRSSPAPSSPTRASGSTNILTMKSTTSPVISTSPPSLVTGPLRQESTSRSPAPAPRTISFLLPPPVAQVDSPEVTLPSSNRSSQPDAEAIQSLHAKIRVLEAKRGDDSRRIQELENRLAEAESFVSLRPKLQAKLTSLSTDLAATKRELADAQQLAQLSESRLLDSQEQLEMAMLDKEVAEEKAEIAETELEDIKERFAVLEVEMNVLKEGGVAGEGGDQGKNSLAYIQLEKQNERLKEALLKLRDMSQETEQDQRRRIAEMEKDILSLDDIQGQYEATLIKLTNAEQQVEDLKLQLDDAFTAEEMLVQLTERNLMLGEKIEEMRITIEDLEALKELSDELEENHVETEKQLYEDLNQRDSQLREYVQKISNLEDACQDLEGTITQFRELVMQLQHELEDLRTQTQTAQNESASAASQTAAMMSLNLKLQSTMSKNQARNIELEIKKLEARESRELLKIVQPYLPQSYVESDSDATNCYLFFQRLGYKADLINTVVAQAHGLPDTLTGTVSEVLVGICEMRTRISGLSTLCKRFAAILRRCDAESFLNIGHIYPEIAPTEKRIDMHIDLLKRDEFREMECVSDIIKIQAQFDHLAETYFADFEHDLGERELGYALAFDHDLDMFAASIGLSKTSVAAILHEEEVTLDMGGYDIDKDLFEPLQSLLDQCKAAKALSKKLTKRLADLIEDSSALKPNLISQLKGLSNFVGELVNFGISLAQQIMPHLSDARAAKSPFQLTTLIGLVKQIASSTVAKGIKPGEPVWDAIGIFITLLLEEGGKLLPVVMESGNVLRVSGTAPWVTRVEEIKSAIAVNAEAERKVVQLNDEMQGLVRNLKTKEQTIQESAVKIELMDRRMEAAKKHADMVVVLENELGKARRQERAYEEAMEQLQADLDNLEQDNAKLKALTAGQERQVPGAQQVETENVPVEGSLETSHLLDQVEALRGTVRFLRTENSYLKGRDLLREIESLPPLPNPRETPPLDPSGFSDTDDSDSDTPRRLPTLRSLTTETRMLYRDVIKFSSSPRVVDLSMLHSKRAEAKGGKVWMPRKMMPGHQVLERKKEAEKLGRRVQGLRDRASMIKNL